MRYLSVQYFAASFAAQGSTNYGDESRNHFLYSRTVAATLHAGGNHEFLGRLGVASSSSYFPPDCPADYKSVLAATGKYTYSAACETEFLNTPGTYVYGVRTGRSNIAQRDDYTLWNSVTVLPQKTATTPATVRAYWCGGEVPVTGKRGPRVLSAEVDYKDFSLTTPLDNPSTTITLWVSEIIRSAKLVQTGKSDINGIPTHTFEPDPSFFEPDPVYSMPFRGSSSHTCPKGVPILLTPPHFYGTPFESATTNTADPLAAGYQTVVPADRPTGSRQKDGVFIHVDRLTGMGIDGNLRLQVNFVIPAGTTGITRTYTYTAAGFFSVLPFSKNAAAAPCCLRPFCLSFCVRARVCALPCAFLVQLRARGTFTPPLSPFHRPPRPRPTSRAQRPRPRPTTS